MTRREQRRNASAVAMSDEIDPPSLCITALSALCARRPAHLPQPCQDVLNLLDMNLGRHGRCLVDPNPSARSPGNRNR